MSEEKTPKHFWIIGLVICAVIAILATIDLSGIWKDEQVETQEVQKETHFNDTLTIRVQIEELRSVKSPPKIKKTKKSK